MSLRLPGQPRKTRQEDLEIRRRRAKGHNRNWSKAAKVIQENYGGAFRRYTIAEVRRLERTAERILLTPSEPDQ